MAKRGVRAEREFSEVSKVLDLDRERLLQIWEQRVRDEMQPSQGEIALRDQMPQFLRQLSQILGSGDRLVLVQHLSDFEPRAEPVRADFSGCPLGQVIFEYSVLRHVIFEVLGERLRLDPGPSLAIHDSIDRAIAEASAKFLRQATDRQREADAERDRTIHQLEAQFAIARVLSYEPDFSEALRKILEIICSRKGWALGAVWYNDTALNHLRCVQVWSSPEYGVSQFIEISKRTYLGRGEGIPGRVWVSGRAEAFPTLTGYIIPARVEAAVREGLRAAIAFPIYVGNSVHGVIEFFARETNEPDRPRLDFMEAVGSQLGQFIERNQVQANSSAILQISLDCIIGMDHLGKVIEFNPASEKLFGYSREEALGKSLAELIIPPGFREPHRQGLARYVETGKSKYMGKKIYFPAIKKDGAELQVELAITEIPHSQPPQFIGFVRDITESRKAEADLAFEKHKLDAVFRESPAAMALWHGDSLIFEMVNSRYEALFGGREFIGKAYLEAIPEFRDQAFAGIIQDVMKTGKTFVGREMLARHRRSPDGPIEERYYNLTYVRVNDPDGRPYGVYVHAVDVTDQVLARKDVERSESELRTTVRELEQEREVRNRFVAALSHDLRNPLSAAKSSVQMVLRYPDKSGSHAALLSRAINSLERVDGMIQDLLDANRIRAGQRLSFKLEECNLRSIASEAIDELSVVHGDRFVLRSPEQVIGCWSPEGLRRVIENLCTNAVKYGSPDSPITLAIEPDQDQVSLSVHNRGPVIPPEQHAELFEAFRRTAEAQASGKRGWGLGLALVNGIVTSHGGRVTLSSTESEGTCFTVRLPWDSSAAVLVT